MRSSSSSENLYSPVSKQANHDDEEWDDDNPHAYRPAKFDHRHTDPFLAQNHNPSRGCPTCCLIFSVAGAIFMFMIAIILSSKSGFYLKLHESSGVTHEEAKGTAVGAGVLYLLMAVYCWYVLKFRRRCCPSKEQVGMAARAVKANIDERRRAKNR